MSGEEEKTNQACSSRFKEDRISQLPDSLLCDILSHLTTKEAVRTSVISTTWRSLWLCVPTLELSSKIFPDLTTFVSFGDRFFDSNRASCIHKLILDIYGIEDDASYLNPWINAAVTRKIQHLYFRCYPQHLYEMPTSLFTCETLVLLKLQWVVLPDAKFFALPCLKTIQLLNVSVPNDATFEKLVSSSPVLDELRVDVASNDAKFYRVHSRSLRKLMFRRASSIRLDVVSGVVIDAPLLRIFIIYDNVSKSFVVKNLESNAKLCINLDFGLEHLHEASVSSRRSRFRSFLPGISSVMYMALEGNTFKVIHDYSKVEPLPQFRCLSCLHATLCVSDLKCLPTFLESCPNLRLLSLTLNDHEEMCSHEMDHISYAFVPCCLSSSLEVVDFRAPISGNAAEMKLVKYFLENSAMLKKLTLTVDRGSNGYDISKELLKIPRRSARCQVVLI